MHIYEIANLRGISGGGAIVERALDYFVFVGIV